MLIRAIVLTALGCSLWAAGSWKPLFNGKNLDGWETRGESVWTVLPDGSLLGQRLHKSVSEPFDAPWPIDRAKYRQWLYRQAWLYTRAEFAEYDLQLEYWLPPGGNGGVSIRDRSRAHFAIGEPDAARPELASFPKTTPANIGYEIQIYDGTGEKYPTGSIYRIVAAPDGVQRPGQWNKLEIESRSGLIRIRVNGRITAESPGDPQRSKTGPIGLQLHDQFSFILFRNIRIREVK